MKTLFVIRHAKSSWSVPGMSDFERPLNERGIRNAPEMAARLRATGHKPDVIVSSTALRTRMTSAAFAKEFGLGNDVLVWEDTLYHASAERIGAVVSRIDNSFHQAIVCCHNPGITDYVNTLCADVVVDHMPTCAIFAVEADIESWEEMDDAPKRFLFFDYPRNTFSR